MPEHIKATVKRTVIDPLELQLSTILSKAQASQENAVTQIKSQVIGPIAGKMQQLGNTGKTASINVIKKAWRQIVQSIRDQVMPNKAAAPV